MRIRRLAALAACSAFVVLIAHPVLSQDAGEEEDKMPIPEIGEDYLADPEHAAAGKAMWDEQCVHCHGRNAYPGKAPKLQPRNYSAGFVFDRVANGFKDMPAWGDYYSEDEIKQITAYVLSDRFSP